MIGGFLHSSYWKVESADLCPLQMTVETLRCRLEGGRSGRATSWILRWAQGPHGVILRKRGREAGGGDEGNRKQRPESCGARNVGRV